jgi:hypothetical protein
MHRSIQIEITYLEILSLSWTSYVSSMLGNTLLKKKFSFQWSIWNWNVYCLYMEIRKCLVWFWLLKDGGWCEHYVRKTSHLIVVSGIYIINRNLYFLDKDYFYNFIVLTIFFWNLWSSGSQFYWWRIPEKTTDLSQVTEKLLSHNVVSSTVHHEQDSNSQWMNLY